MDKLYISVYISVSRHWFPSRIDCNVSLIYCINETTFNVNGVVCEKVVGIVASRFIFNKVWINVGDSFTEPGRKDSSRTRWNSRQRFEERREKKIIPPFTHLFTNQLWKTLRYSIEVSFPEAQHRIQLSSKVGTFSLDINPISAAATNWIRVPTLLQSEERRKAKFLFFSCFFFFSW